MPIRFTKVRLDRCRNGVRGGKQHLLDRHRRLQERANRLRVRTADRPKDYFSSFNTHVHGIIEDHVAGKPCFGDLHPEIARHLTGRITVAHSYFDKGALAAACRVHDRGPIPATWLDSVRVAKRVWPDLPSHRLNIVSNHSGIRLKHHDALSEARAAGLIVMRAIGDTGRPLASWLSTARVPTRPTPAADGPLIGQRVTILGQLRHGQIAQCVAAQGGRIMTSVGKTTTMLTVVADEPFGYVRHAQFKMALELQSRGSGIEIVSAAALERRLSASDDR